MTEAMAIISEMRKVLEFYSKSSNWERIAGHTKWASNLKEQDCAFLNCGGGRARKVLASVEPRIKRLKGE